jgi:putative ABC transport system permease protein
VGVREKAPGLGIDDMNASPATYFTFREENNTFQDTGLWRTDSFSVTGLGEPEQVDSLEVTDGTLPIIGVRPAHERWFTRMDDSPGRPQTVMLTYGYWQRKFGRDPTVLGRRIVIDGEAREIIGIMPQTFGFMNRNIAVILPFQLDRSKVFIGNFSFLGIARLESGVTLAQANIDVARMLPIMSRKFPPAPGMNLKMLEQLQVGPNLRALKADVVGDIGKMLWVLMATVGTVLFIACANVANLLLVRAEGRQQELAIRSALGAGWARIARELLLESVTLGMLGGALGLALAYIALRLLVSLGPSQLPRLDEISIDPPVVLFTVVVSLVAGVFFGLIPVFKYAGPRLQTALQQGGRTSSGGRNRHRARSVLVVVQVSLALVLLVSSGLMIRSIGALQKVQPDLRSRTRS